MSEEMQAPYPPGATTMNDDRLAGLRLGRAQEVMLRAWPKDRIRPKSVALGVISLLAEVDALRAELAAIREAVGAQPDEPTLRAVGDMMTERQHYVNETTRMAADLSAAREREAALREAGEAFVTHHDNGQAGHPGFPRTYGELKVWQVEWDRRLAALRALVTQDRR